jgi:membrane protease YdiL (CAAX protease family)
MKLPDVLKENRRAALFGVSVIWIVVMLWAVPFATQAFGAHSGYLVVFLAYWLLFCLPFGLLFQKRGTRRARLRFDHADAWWVPWAVAAQLISLFAASTVLLPDGVTITVVVLAVLFGVTNGFLEEFFWRGAYLDQGGESPAFLCMGLVLFTAWHVPLALARGVVYEGGAGALIGGAFALGTLWTVIAYITQQTGWTTFSHILTNVMAFTGALALNLSA